MKVKELIEKLQTFDGNLSVFSMNPNRGYELVNTVEVKNIVDDITGMDDKKNAWRVDFFDSTEGMDKAVLIY